MSANPFMDALREAFGDTARALGLGGSSQVSYRYWRLKPHEAGNRREEMYAYGTKRSKGPDGSGALGWWSWVWVFSTPKGPTHRQIGTVTRATRCATRRRAQNVAYRRYLVRRGKEPHDYPVRHRPPPFPTGPDGGHICADCKRGYPEIGSGLSYAPAVANRWLCRDCLAKVETAPLVAAAVSVPVHKELEDDGYDGLRGSL